MAAVASNAFVSGSQVAAYLKTRFPDKEIENVFKFGKPTMESLGEFKSDLTGDSTVIPFLHSTPQGLGASLKAAIRNITSSRAARWIVTPANFYGAITVDAKSMAAASGANVGAFLSLKEQEMRTSLDQGGQEFEKQLWGTGHGSEGTFNADPGTGTSFQLVRPEHAINFQPGMKFLVYADSSGVPDSATLRAGGPYEVATMDYLTGAGTVTAAFNAAVAVGDHLVRDGNIPVAGINQLITGIPGWIPTAAPGSALHFGLNRTLFPTQLVSGWRGTWKGTIEETFKTLDAQMRRLGRQSVALWLSYANYNRLESEMGARAIREANGGTATAGYSGLMMTSGGKRIKVKAGPYVPETHGWLLDEAGWSLHSLRQVPHIIRDDGMDFYRIRGGNAEANAEDGVALEWRAWPQLVCDAPFDQGVAPIV